MYAVFGTEERDRVRGVDPVIGKGLPQQRVDPLLQLLGSGNQSRVSGRPPQRLTARLL